jgi:photosystem I subunit XI
MADQVVKPFNDDPFTGNLSTPISNSGFTRAFIDNLPAYRKGLSAQRRGLEVGMAHGYFMFGPFAYLGPLRATEMAPTAGLIATVSMVVLLTVALSLYAAAGPSKSDAAENMSTAEGWSEFAGGFFIGACGGAFFAYLLCMIPHPESGPLQMLSGGLWK